MSRKVIAADSKKKDIEQLKVDSDALRETSDMAIGCVLELADMAYMQLEENEILKAENAELKRQNEIIAGSVMEVFETFLPLLEEV